MRLVIIVFLVLLASQGTEGIFKKIGKGFTDLGKGIVKVGKGIGKGVTKVAEILKKGCCGVHRSVCDMQNEFKNRQNDIKKKAAVIDRHWVTVKKISAQIKSCNHYNNMIYQHIRRITLVSESTIEILDPKIIAKFNNVTDELRRAVEHKNQTVLKYGIDQIADEYDKTKKDSNTEILDASGIGGFQMTGGYVKMTADMFRMMKLEAVAKFMESDVGNFLNKAKLQVNKLFGFHYLEKLAQRNKVLSGVLNVLSFYNKYLSFHGGIFRLMDFMSKLTGWITDLATCEKQKRDLEKNIGPLRKDHATINKNYLDIFKHKKNAENNWKTVRGQSISEGVFNQLVSIEDIARQASSQSSKSAQTTRVISNFRAKAKRATPDNLIKLQKELADALSSVTYTAECYERKLAMYESVYRGCKIGQASFVDLYERALLDFKPNESGCRDSSGLPYTTRDDVNKFLKKKADKERFEMNCLLNSGLKKARTCEEIHAGYSISQVASKLSITVANAENLSKTCPSPALNSIENIEVCSLSRFLKLDKVYRVYPDVSKTVIQEAFAKCK